MASAPRAVPEAAWTLPRCLLACLLLRLGGAQQPSPVVTVGQGRLRGTCDASGTCAYLGIPYAAPPVGDLRWRPPQPAAKWGGVRDAASYGSICPQISGSKVVGSESCLFLNIWVPPHGACRIASCAVMFWIHGGSYMTGSGSDYNGTGLARLGGNVIVVTTNYRLNILGFLGSDQLRGRDTHDHSTGNYGIQDQRAALIWVRQNIGQFGGDVGNIMIFGESAGGGSVSMHLTMQRSWSLYQKAAIESGSYSYWTAQPMQEAEQQYTDVLNVTGCASLGRLQCLLAYNATWLLPAAIYYLPQRKRPYGCEYAPTVDGVELAQLPWKLRDAGQFNTRVPVLLGYNKDEGTIGIDESSTPEDRIYEKVRNMTAGDFVRLLTGVQFNIHPDELPAILDIYSVNSPSGGLDYSSWYWVATHFNGDYSFSCPTRRTARALNRFSRSNVYMYYFAHVPRGKPFSWAGVKGRNNTAGASHASEIAFVFLDETSDTHALVGDDEKLLSRTMAGYWINFARASDPNPPTLPGDETRTSLTIKWEPFKARRESSVRFDLPGLSAMVGRNNGQCDVVDKLGVVDLPWATALATTEGRTHDVAAGGSATSSEALLMV